MSSIETAFSHTVKKLVGLMLGMIAIAAIIGFYQRGQEFTLALLYGGAITVISAVFFAWRLRIATRSADNNALNPGSVKQEPAVNAAILFQAIVLRLVMIIGLLAAGMSWLKLDPLGMIIGFSLPLTAYWFSGDSYGKTRRR